MKIVVIISKKIIFALLGIIIKFLKGLVNSKNKNTKTNNTEPLDPVLAQAKNAAPEAMRGKKIFLLLPMYLEIDKKENIKNTNDIFPNIIAELVKPLTLVSFKMMMQ
jgi:hypothetical protein